MHRASLSHSRRKSPPTEHPATRSVGRIAAWIRQAIREGRFAPGQRLIEADLEAELSVKRGPVREALRILAGDGIIELVPQKGARVRKLTAQDIRDLLPVLSGMLRMTLDLAIPRVGQAPYRAQLEQAMLALRQAHKHQDAYGVRIAGLRYTDVLLEATNNSYLTYLSSKLYPELFYRQMSDTLRPGDWSHELAQFEAIHQACLRGDKERAFRALAEQMPAMQARLPGKDK
jgi:DNA-binding GntR family transcriptional regulator